MDFVGFGFGCGCGGAGFCWLRLCFLCGGCYDRLWLWVRLFFFFGGGGWQWVVSSCLIFF